jgi:hypothetical protein
MGRTYITVPSSENSSENSPSRSNLMHDDQSDIPPKQKLTVEHIDCGKHVPVGTPQTIRDMLADGGELVTWTHVENIAQELQKQQTKLFRPVYAHHAVKLAIAKQIINFSKENLIKQKLFAAAKTRRTKVKDPAEDLVKLLRGAANLVLQEHNASDSSSSNSSSSNSSSSNSSSSSSSNSSSSNSSSSGRSSAMPADYEQFERECPQENVWKRLWGALVSWQRAEDKSAKGNAAAVEANPSLRHTQRRMHPEWIEGDHLLCTLAVGNFNQNMASSYAAAACGTGMTAGGEPALIVKGMDSGLSCTFLLEAHKVERQGIEYADYDGAKIRHRDDQKRDGGENGRAIKPGTKPKIVPACGKGEVLVKEIYGNGEGCQMWGTESSSGLPHQNNQKGGGVLERYEVRNAKRQKVMVTPQKRPSTAATSSPTGSPAKHTAGAGDTPSAATGATITADNAVGSVTNSTSSSANDSGNSSTDSEISHRYRIREILPAMRLYEYERTSGLGANVPLGDVGNQAVALPFHLIDGLEHITSSHGVRASKEEPPS